ncbi:MAG TPA: MBL fold metallo-hydrolase [Candidatus Polarisedimenticolia bacterium]|nr:MBL fold metallo-hydrolase [Candidatus Polarisedimenticolia bacterium]
MRRWLSGIAVALALATTGARAAGTAPVKALKVTVLSTMLAGDVGIGEWGFAALLEVDGRRLLIDTGDRPETVLHNAEELKIDLSTVTDVVITHNHGDHTGGLLALRRELAKRNPQALSLAHVAPGIFLSRLTADGREDNGLLPIKPAYESLGGTFIEHSGPERLFPGVWLTGPVPRPHPERNWSGSRRLQTPAGPVEDTIPEDASVVVESSDGLVVVSGCGHAGIVNTLEYARKVTGEPRVLAAIGGFHLFEATDERLAWTARKLHEFGLGHLLGAHCTGVEAVFRIRRLAGLSRKTAVVGAVGSSFTLGAGLDPLSLAR